MKQGHASSRTSTHKTEPSSRAVSPHAVAQTGIAQGNHAENRDLPVKHTKLYDGRGLEAPMKGSTQHHCGSQGKY